MPESNLLDRDDMEEIADVPVNDPKPEEAENNQNRSTVSGSGGGNGTPAE